MAKNPPTVRMRRLGAQMRKLREDRGLTLDEAAALLNVSKSALSRMENAQAVTRPFLVEYVLIKFGINDQDLRYSLLGLAAAGRSKAWVKRHGPLPPGADDYIRLEQDSTLIQTFQPHVIPGLLQTPEYARAVIWRVRRNLDGAVAFRMARKDVINRSDPASLEVVVGEAALRQQVGGAEVIRGQLRHLLEESQRGNVRLQVLPFTASGNPGADGAFTMLNVEAGSFQVVAVENMIGGIIIEDESDVTSYIAAYEDICAMALPEEETRAFIGHLLDEWQAAAGGP